MSARILIVEDNYTNLELMSYLLSSYGHAVQVAVDGRAGLELARRESPNLIICDVQLPDMDGFEVARCLKSHPRLRAIPLVAVTALAMVGDRDRVLAAGFDGYMAKPIQPETFVQEVEGFLPTTQRTTTPAPNLETAAAPEYRAISQGQTILAVDDLPVNLDLARSLFEPSGYKVITGGGMTEGLALARENSCDLILSDVCMSEGSGYEFLQAVKADPQLRLLPFVLITSTMIGDADRAKGIALGATRFLRRPIEPQALLDEIRGCLRERGRTERGDHSDCR